MQIAYISFYAIDNPYDLNTSQVPLGKINAPSDHEFYSKNLKVLMNVVSMNCRVDEMSQCQKQDPI